MAKGRAYHHGNLRAALIEAGVALLKEGGPEALTTRACAASVGVAPSAVFRHFKDRKALATAIAAHGFRLLGAAIEESATQNPRRFRAIGEAYIDFALKEPELFRLMFRGELIHDTDPEFLEAARPLLADTAAQSSAEGAAARDRAVVAWAVVHGLATLSIDSQLERTLPKDREQRRARLMELLGLTAPMFKTD